ncbi:hypothetical protein LNQ03_03440, partial [Klebsiella pneumoniae subsp. pneumoniae]|nr:hypothetical protein [Klebsiella pneumoniae subsp. pneumoniae]
MGMRYQRPGRSSCMVFAADPRRRRAGVEASMRPLAPKRCRTHRVASRDGFRRRLGSAHGPGDGVRAALGGKGKASRAAKRGKDQAARGNAVQGSHHPFLSPSFGRLPKRHLEVRMCAVVAQDYLISAHPRIDDDPPGVHYAAPPVTAISTRGDARYRLVVHNRTAIQAKKPRAARAELAQPGSGAGLHRGVEGRWSAPSASSSCLPGLRRRAQGRPTSFERSN